MCALITARNSSRSASVNGSRTSALRRCISRPGSPWENGYCESFNSKLRDEFLNGEIFYSLKEAQILTERWRVHYNTVRPHSSLGYRPPAPMAYRLAMPPPSESRSVPSAVM